VARLTQTGALRPGDILKIERAGSAVKYYRNGTQLSYQNNAAISTALMVDASLQSNNATLVGVRLQAASGLTWKDQVGVAATGGTLAGTAPSGWGNSGAASVETLPANTNGWLEVANTQPDTHRMIGLSSANANASYETIQYALYLTGDQFTVYENGAQQPVLRPLAVGDVLRVERTGGTVRYYQNGALAYTSPVPCSAALLADASIYSQGGRLEGIRASFAGAGGGRTVTKRMQYDHAGRLLRTHHQINGGAEVLLSALEYNELGEEVTKKLHSTDNGSTFKQSVDYRYNIRGWMTSINNSSLANDGGATNSDTNDLFGMNLYYNQVVAGINNVADYTGNISAVAWSNYLSQSGIKERGYRFLYDELNRLSAATHVEKTSAWASSTSLHEDNLTYDHNGNIKTLNRKGAGASALDIMVYNYGSGTTLSNKMLSITDNGDKAKGFLDNNTTGNDYTYDNNGSQLTDKNKGITATVYNHFNQPTKVTVTNGDYMTYTYDGAGARLGKGLYNSANLLKRQTDYVGDFVYENDTLKFIRHGDGRIMMTGASAEYQYELRDNKDNVRVMFTSQPLQDIATATYEPANATAEQGKYLRYTSAKMVNSSLFDKTNGSAPSLATGYAQRLNGSANEKYGVARSISVMPGDVVKAEVYAKYVDPNTSNWNGALNALMSQIASGTAGVVVDGANYSTSTSTFPAAYPNLVSKTDNGAPKAYLNWLVFDRDFVFLTGGFQQISTACRETGTDVAHEYLASPDIIIAQPGYVYIYVSNDNATPVDVFFDEVRVTQNASPIVQTNTYYPFGMDIPSLSYQREGNKKNNYLYNGRSELQDDLGLNSYFTPLRIEETDAPRWWQVDPLTDGQESWSPYNYSYDNPIRYNDPRGDCPCLVYPIGIAIVEAAVAVTGGTLTYLTLKQYGKQIFEAMGNGSPYSTPAVSFAQTTGGANSLNSESKKPKGSNNPTTKESAETGQEAHRQEQKKLKEQGAETEVPMELKDGTKVRKDAVKPDGTAVIIKPDTPTGRKSAAKREKLMEKNEKKTETILYDPKDPKYKPDSPTYIGPKKD
jgi:YD repeat-containing protein